MEIQHSEQFEKIAKACGNRYTAIKWLARRTRELEEKTKDYHIAESKMITWALTGQCPYSDVQLERRKHLAKVDHLSEILEFVTDKEVKDEVITFYKLSVRQKGLQLCDRVELGSSRLSRINILLRMAWYHFK